MDNLRKLIQKRASLLQKIKTAKGSKLTQLQAELELVQKDIRRLDEKQQ